MIKQQQRVIKKGDYYEMQTYEQTMMLISKSKKQQQQQSSTANLPVNEQILTEVPTWKQARDQYFCTGLMREFQNKGVDQLLEELIKMTKQQEQGLRDQDRKEIQMLMEEIDAFANCKEVELNELPSIIRKKAQQSAKPQQSAKLSQQPHHTTITLTAKYNITNISQRITRLQSLDFPQLISLEHQLQIMLGEKKPLQSLQLPHMDEKQKQQLNNLYNHLNSLSVMNNTQRVVDSVFMNEGKHVEMQAWLEKVERVQAVNGDLLVELKQDQEIVNRLEKNFVGNVRQVREILEEIKKQK